MTSTDPAGAPSAPSYSDDDIDAAIAVLKMTPQGEVSELFTLTDEELLAVDGVQHPQLTELPWVSANAGNPELHKLVAAVALRSLLARGLVTTSADARPEDYVEGSTARLSFDAVPELRGVAVLRRIPEAFILVQRRTAAGNAAAYFYLFVVQDERRVLWESYDASGMHVFHLVPAELLAAQIRAFVDPANGIGQDDGDTETVSVSGFEASPQAAELAGARAVCSVAVASTSSDSLEGFTSFAMPERLVLMESDEDVHRLGAVGEQSFLGIVEDLVAEALSEQDA